MGCGLSGLRLWERQLFSRRACGRRRETRQLRLELRRRLLGYWLLLLRLLRCWSVSRQRRSLRELLLLLLHGGLQLCGRGLL